MSNSATPALADLLAHTRWVEALAQSLVRDPNVAADLAQSTLLVALERSAPPKNLRGWLARVLRNQARERFRRESSRADVETRGARHERLPGADELIERAECERRIVAAVLALEEPHRSTLLLRYFEELSPEEIARRSAVALSTVSSRITRAHACLRARLGEDDPRADWLAALTPILSRRSETRPTSNPASVSNTLELLIMSTAAKVLLVVAIGAAALWLALPRHVADSSAADTARVDPPADQPAAPALDVAAPKITDERQPIVAATETKAPAKEEALAAPPLPDDGRIFGQVFRPDGRVAAKRKVRMIRSNTGPEKYVDADDEGKFDAAGLGPGLWSLSTWPDKTELAALGKADENTIDGFVYMTQRTVELAAGKEIEVILGRPPEAGVHVQGRMTLDGALLDGYLTWLPEGKDSMDRQKIATASDTKGFDLLLDTPGRYLVIAIHGESRVEFAVDVPAGPEFTHDLVFPTLALKGKITSWDGRPVAGARADLTPRGGLSPRHPAANITYSHASGPDGVFSFASIPPAHYALGIHAGGVGDSKEPVGAKSIRELDLSAGGEVPTIEIVLERAALLQGFANENSRGIPYADVFVIDESGEPLNPLQGVASKQDGTFELFALAPGTYSAVAAAGEKWSDFVRFTVPAQGDLPILDLAVKPAAKISIDISGQQPAWIDLRNSTGICVSALLDKHVFNRTLTRDWSSSTFVYRVPAGEYSVAVVGVAGRASEQKIIALAGESLSVDLGKR